MTRQASKDQGDDEGTNRVRDALRGLRKVRAPGNLDAELRRRLSREPERRSPRFFSRPAPAYVLTACTVAAAGVLGYFALLSPSDLTNEEPIIADSVGLFRDIEEPVPPPIPPQPSPRDVVIQEQPPGEIRGPSAPVKELSIESRVIEHSPQQLHVRPLEGLETGTDTGLVSPLFIARPKGAGRTSSAVDSLKREAQPDSLEQKRAEEDSLRKARKE